MKKLSILLLFLLPHFCSAQEKSPLDAFKIRDGVVFYTDVVKVDSTSKQELFDRARKWFLLRYKSATEKLDLDDKENNEAIGHIHFTIWWQYNHMSGMFVEIYTSLRIEAKDNRYKYELADFVVHYSKKDGEKQVFATPLHEFPANNIKSQYDFYPRVDVKIKELINEFKQSMRRSDKDNW